MEVKSQEMRKMETINIGCSSNDRYAQHLGVMIYSLLSNCSTPKKVKFSVVDSKISQNNKEKIKEVVRKFGAQMEFITPDYDRIKDLKMCRYLGMETYQRFSLIDKMKSDRMLYLDCDMVVRGDISEIYFKNFGKSVLFAVEDVLVGDKKKETVGLSKSDPYFNGGFLLINCDKWRKERISNEVIDFIKENPEKIVFADQDGLNAILKGRWTKLDGSWNTISRTALYKKFYFIFNKEYSERLKKLPNVVNIVHYAGYPKPWLFWHVLPFKREYLRYLRKSPWKGYKFPDKSITGLFREIFSLAETMIQKIKNGNLI